MSNAWLYSVVLAWVPPLNPGSRSPLFLVIFLYKRSVSPLSTLILGCGLVTPAFSRLPWYMVSLVFLSETSYFTKFSTSFKTFSQWLVNLYYILLPFNLNTILIISCHTPVDPPGPALHRLPVFVCSITPVPHTPAPPSLDLDFELGIDSFRQLKDNKRQ